jgi:hypothetical protein
MYIATESIKQEASKPVFSSDWGYYIRNKLINKEAGIEIAIYIYGSKY